MILEALVTTLDAGGAMHLAPMGPHVDPAEGKGGKIAGVEPVIGGASLRDVHKNAAEQPCRARDRGGVSQNGGAVVGRICQRMKRKFVQCQQMIDR